MRRLLLIVTLGFTTLLLVVSMWAWYGLGLGEYIRARWYIAQLDEAKRPAIVEQFNGRSTDQVYGGILAGIYFDQIWLWSDDGIKRYPLIVGGSSYTYFSMCYEENRAKIRQGETNLAIRRLSTTADQTKWIGKVGDYVRVEIDAGEVREAHGFDWWIFAQQPTRQLCRG